jgi:monoterpene epsilon-lactone hydrolase
MRASWQARVATFFTRRFVRARLVRSPDVTTIRKTFNATKQRVPRGCHAREDILGGVRGEWMSAEGVTPMATMLYLHGGAYVACSPQTHRPITSWFARHGWRVFAPDYRLAPEHRFPAQIKDAVAVYRTLLETGVAHTQIVVAGDSAGGNLSLALCLSLRAAGLPQPAAIALFSPVTDFAWTGTSIAENSERCAMFSREILPRGTTYYLGDHNPRDPLASPQYADLNGLPPMCVQVGEDEVLRDDSIRLAQRAKQAGIEANLRVWPTVPHVWQLLHKWIPEGRESLQQSQDFLARHIQAAPLRQA